MKVCNCCGKSLPITTFKLMKGQYRAGKCNLCVNATNRLNRAEKKSPPVQRPVRHAWEALGADCRPKWSRV